MRRLIFMTAFAAILLSGCTPQHRGIVVGSKNFTEQAVLGEILAQYLEHKTGLPVERRFYLAGSYICHQSLLADRIDMYPEYTGTALAAILKEKPSGTSEDVYRRVKEEYARRFNVEAGLPFGFNNSFAIIIRGDDALRLHVRTLTEVAKYAPQWRMGVGYEFLERPDGCDRWFSDRRSDPGARSCRAGGRSPLFSPVRCGSSGPPGHARALSRCARRAGRSGRKDQRAGHAQTELRD